MGDSLEGTTENGTEAGTISLPYETFALHCLQEGGGPTITDAKPPL
jgi:hypothetical protein